MKISRRIVASSLGLALVALTITQSAAAVTLPKLLWSQSFNEKAGTKVSSKFWSYDLGNGMGWGNQEREYYTNKAANISMDGKGNLVITALKLNPDDPKDQYITNWCVDCVYSSAKIVTRGKLAFKYGSISARMQVPEGVGMWPAFWLLGVPRSTCDGWPSCGEIDIMEMRGSDVYHTVSTLHGPGYSGGGGLSSYFFTADPITPGFHNYRVDWLPNSIKFYVDNELVGGQTRSSVSPNEWVFNAPFYMILNLATGGNFDGGALDENIQKAEFKVDSISYRQLKGYGQLIRY